MIIFNSAECSENGKQEEFYSFMGAYVIISLLCLKTYNTKWIRYAVKKCNFVLIRLYDATGIKVNIFVKASCEWLNFHTSFSTVLRAIEWWEVFGLPVQFLVS